MLVAALDLTRQIELQKGNLGPIRPLSSRIRIRPEREEERLPVFNLRDPCQLLDLRTADGAKRRLVQAGLDES